MSSNEPQDIHGYGYIPLTEGGKYQTKLEGYFSTAANIAQAAVGVYFFGQDPASATRNSFISDFVGKAGGELGNTVGWYIDNLSNIESNLGIAFGALNDSKFWMGPDLAN